MKELQKLCNCSDCFNVKEVRFVRLYKKIKLKDGKMYYYNNTGYFTYNQLLTINGCGNQYCDCETNKLVSEEWNDAESVEPLYLINTK